MTKEIKIFVEARAATRALGQYVLQLQLLHTAHEHLSDHQIRTCREKIYELDQAVERLDDMLKTTNHRHPVG
jgi:hypothetical protein